MAAWASTRRCAAPPAPTSPWTSSSSSSTRPSPRTSAKNSSVRAPPPALRPRAAAPPPPPSPPHRNCRRRGAAGAVLKQLEALEQPAGAERMEQGGEEWKAARRKLLTASDFGAAVGVRPQFASKYPSRVDLFLDKVGIHPAPFNGNDHTDRGHLLEPYVRCALSHTRHSPLRPLREPHRGRCGAELRVMEGGRGWGGRPAGAGAVHGVARPRLRGDVRLARRARDAAVAGRVAGRAGGAGRAAGDQVPRAGPAGGPARLLHDAGAGADGGV